MRSADQTETYGPGGHWPDDRTLMITFNEAMKAMSVPANSAFTVKAR